MWLSRTGLAMLLLALGCATARSDDGHSQSEDPDSGFFEFLGSIDQLADTNPDYLSQAGAPAGRPQENSVTTPPPPAPSPPPQPLPPPIASASSAGHNNE
jgi:hypothetical protein